MVSMLQRITWKSALSLDNLLFVFKLISSLSSPAVAEPAHHRLGAGRVLGCGIYTSGHLACPRSPLAGTKSLDTLAFSCESVVRRVLVKSYIGVYTTRYILWI